MIRFFIAAILALLVSHPSSAKQYGDPHSSPDDHKPYYCRSLRLDYPYTETCPEPWVTVDAAEKSGEYKPLISCGSAGCFPMDDTDASRAAAAQANAENSRAAGAIAAAGDANAENERDVNGNLTVAAQETRMKHLRESWDRFKGVIVSMTNSVPPWESWVGKFVAIIVVPSFIFFHLSSRDNGTTTTQARSSY
jgi:hypothetical protein